MTAPRQSGGRTGSDREFGGDQHGSSVAEGRGEEGGGNSGNPFTANEMDGRAGERGADDTTTNDR